VEGSPTAVVVLDAEGIVIGWTKAAEALFGCQAADIFGRSCAALIMLDDHAAQNWNWTERFGDRERWSGPAMVRHVQGHKILVNVEIHRVLIQNQTFRWLVSATPASASVIRTWMVDASGRIGTTLDVKQTAQELADLAVPALADYVTVDLASAVLPEDEPLHRLASSDASIPVFRRAGMASINKGFPEALYKLGEAVYVPPDSPFTGVLASGRSYFEPVLDTSSGGWLDEDRLTVIRETGMHSLIIVPLRARGDVLGNAVFVRTEHPTPFTPEDLRLAEELAARAALSLDNARRYTRERAASLALQRHLLPRRLSGGGVIEVASRYLPADAQYGVGGDLFDTIPLPDSRVGLVVGDVTGHGIKAAARMGRLRTAMHALAYMGLPPDQLLARLDDLITHIGEQYLDTEDISLATCLYAVYDPATRRCTMAAAGHPPPAIVDPDGTVTFPRLPTGTPIGLGVGSYESLEVELAEGTLIALYTDGLIETREADLDAGMDRLGAALSQAALPLENVCNTVIDTMVTDTSDDDVALLIARIRA
jgi:PAS domain S-box-containing protein